MAKLTIEKDRCKGCQLCISACPRHILELSKELNTKGYFYAVMVDPQRCTTCLMCAITCPDIAIEVSGDGEK